MQNINIPQAIRDLADLVADIVAGASDIDGKNAAETLSRVENLAARIFAASVQSQAQLATGLASALAIAHYAPAVATTQESAPAVQTRERARRRSTAASVTAPRSVRGSRPAPSR